MFNPHHNRPALPFPPNHGGPDFDVTPFNEFGPFEGGHGPRHGGPRGPH